MNIENYHIYLAPKGSKAHTAATAIANERIAAHQSRLDYSRTHKADGLWASDGGVSGLLFKEPPKGWRSTDKTGSGAFVCKPDRKTKEGRALAEELKKLPCLPTFKDFTRRIGSCWVIIPDGTGRHQMLMCAFEEIGGKIYVLVPIVPPKELHDGNDPQFVPDGCKRVTLAAYYAAKGK